MSHHASGSVGGFFWFGGLEHNAKISSAMSSTTPFLLLRCRGQQGHLFSGAFFKGSTIARSLGWDEESTRPAVSLSFGPSQPSPNTFAVISNFRSCRALPGTTTKKALSWKRHRHCGSVGANVSGTIVRPVPSFAKPGSEETVDHYEVYLSVDGKHLMDAASIPVRGEPFDMAALKLTPGAYLVLVQMVGKSHILNQISTPVQLTIGGVSTPDAFPQPCARSNIRTQLAPVMTKRRRRRHTAASAVAPAHARLQALPSLSRLQRKAGRFPIP